MSLKDLLIPEKWKLYSHSLGILLVLGMFLFGSGAQYAVLEEQELEETPISFLMSVTQAICRKEKQHAPVHEEKIFQDGQSIFFNRLESSGLLSIDLTFRRFEVDKIRDPPVLS